MIKNISRTQNKYPIFLNNGDARTLNNKDSLKVRKKHYSEWNKNSSYINVSACYDLSNNWLKQLNYYSNFLFLIFSKFQNAEKDFTKLAPSMYIANWRLFLIFRCDNGGCPGRSPISDILHLTNLYRHVTTLPTLVYFVTPIDSLSIDVHLSNKKRTIWRHLGNSMSYLKLFLNTKYCKG